VQQATRIRESFTEYFDETIDGLEEIDFSKVEIVLIQHGLNDYYSGIPLDNEEDPYDDYTVQGALRNAITTLQKNYPDLRIILATPTYSWYRAGMQTCEEFNAGYGFLEDYVEAQIAVAKELGVETIDLYHDLYPHEKWEDWEIYTRDGLHPNDEGRTLIAQRLAEYLRETKQGNAD
jgi:lysophospholipase L1-like esterase